ncbi:unnamed protein product [Zymoseptoria tritici ST99CH_3D7]|uniref:Uncharacterized protein n=1 Tax=Zymoseptoria tritici (strain ST99CH_3D7) TaxID=1276538 RepID=A0A1X7RXK9_ZYMT9|nr:unnamed protein product [Zymoseptoria tritici ST99CH_3D7]
MEHGESFLQGPAQHIRALFDSTYLAQQSLILQQQLLLPQQSSTSSVLTLWPRGLPIVIYTRFLLSSITHPRLYDHHPAG